MTVKTLKNFRRLGLLSLLLVLGWHSYGQQNQDERQLLSVLENAFTTTVEMQRVETVLQAYRGKINAAQAEIEILKAQLNKELLPAEPNREEIRAIIRKSLDFEAEIRIAEMERQLDLRKLMGDRIWPRFAQLLRLFREQQKNGQALLQRALQANPVRQRILLLLQELTR